MRGFESLIPNPSFAKASEWFSNNLKTKAIQNMYYTYILYSLKSKNFYYGYTEDLKNRLNLHQTGKVQSTKPFLPWKLVCYAAFENMKLAKEFELYLKSGSGKAFAYKRLLDSGALKKDK